MLYLCFERIRGLRGFISIQSRGRLMAVRAEVLAKTFFFLNKEGSSDTL